MKKVISPLFLILSIIAVPTAVSHAEGIGASLQASAIVSTDKPTTTATADASTGDTPAATDDLKDLPLAQRRDAVAAQLLDLTTKFSTYATRTQLTIDRLTAKSINTGKAQDELTLSVNGLAAAKLSLDTLTKIEVPDTNQDKAVVEIKDSVKKIQDQLKDARTHLINALTSVKVAVTATLGADASAQ